MVVAGFVVRDLQGVLDEMSWSKASRKGRIAPVRDKLEKKNKQKGDTGR